MQPWRLRSPVCPDADPSSPHLLGGRCVGERLDAATTARTVTDGAGDGLGGAGSEEDSGSMPPSGRAQRLAGARERLVHLRPSRWYRTPCPSRPSCTVRWVGNCSLFLCPVLPRAQTVEGEARQIAEVDGSSVIAGPRLIDAGHAGRPG